MRTHERATIAVRLARRLNSQSCAEYAAVMALAWLLGADRLPPQERVAVLAFSKGWGR